MLDTRTSILLKQKDTKATYIAVYNRYSTKITVTNSLTRVELLTIDKCSIVLIYCRTLI